MAVALAGGGFAAGRSTGPGVEDSGASPCADVKAMVDARLAESNAASDAQDKEKSTEALREAALAVGQNPNCFDASTRVTAQKFLDDAKQDADDAALCRSARSSSGNWSMVC
ncbi:hypothetical protein [Streptomyces sp. DT18]